MNHDARTPFVVLVVLAGVGVSLAGVGVALGVGDIDADRNRIGEVSVAGPNVTVTNGHGEAVLTETVPTTSDIKISENGSGITVAEQAENPATAFTQRERDRAVEIARRNETVRSYLETVAEPTFRVEPVKKLSTKEMQTVTVKFNESGEDDVDVSGEDTQVLKVTNVTVTESSGSVTIDREPTYVEDVAVVRITHPGWDSPRYSVRVDLANRTVTDITDWSGVSTGES